MDRCLICFKAKEETFNELKICKKCRFKFKILAKTIFVDGVETFILYEYDEFFKEILYRYKGCYDYQLKDAFFNEFKDKLIKKYKGRQIVCAPSYFKDDENRGFNHLIEIAKLLKLEISNCLSKSSAHKQSSVEYKERGVIQNIIKFDKKGINLKKGILIFDDVTTSLSTLRAIIRLLPTNIDKKALILSSNCRFMGNEFV